MEPEGSLLCSQEPATCPYPEPNEFQSIRPIPRPFVTFRNMFLFLRWGVVSPPPNPQAGGPPLVGCPRLLIQYIRSYPPCLEAFSMFELHGDPLFVCCKYMSVYYFFRFTHFVHSYGKIRNTKCRGRLVSSHIWEVRGSNLGPETGYNDRNFSWFSSIPPGTCRDSTLIRPYRFLPYFSFSLLSINHPVIRLCAV
jgi:hypothetical protein